MLYLPSLKQNKRFLFETVQLIAFISSSSSSSPIFPHSAQLLFTLFRLHKIKKSTFRNMPFQLKRFIQYKIMMSTVPMSSSFFFFVYFFSLSQQPYLSISSAISNPLLFVPSFTLCPRHFIMLSRTKFKTDFKN